MSISSGKRTVLLTLGRLPVALELARALHSGGWRVVVAEPFAWHLCRLSNCVSKSYTVTPPTVDNAAYLSELESIVRTEGVSLVVPVSEDTLFVSALQGRLPESAQLICMVQASLLQLHDKFHFAQLAKQHGLPVPQTALASDAQACRQITTMSYVVKPRLSCSGMGVRFADAASGLQAEELNDRYIVQQRLPGLACSSFSIAAGGQVLTSVCYRSLIESGSVSVCFEQMAVPDDVASFIESIVNATCYSGMIAFDFIQDTDGLWQAIECNPRATSGLHFLQTVNILRALVDGEAIELQPVSGKKQEFWSSLMKVEGALFRGRIDRAGWRNLLTAQDITWRRSDMKPFLLMSFVLAPQLFKAIRVGKPVSELLMNDIGWHDSERE